MHLIGPDLQQRSVARSPDFESFAATAAETTPGHGMPQRSERTAGATAAHHVLSVRSEGNLVGVVSCVDAADRTRAVDIPETDRVVVAARRERFSIRAERDSHHRLLVFAQRTERIAGVGIP